jgi:hypothetical protein
MASDNLPRLCPLTWGYSTHRFIAKFETPQPKTPADDATWLGPMTDVVMVVTQKKERVQ